MTIPGDRAVSYAGSGVDVCVNGTGRLVQVATVESWGGGYVGRVLMLCGEGEAFLSPLQLYQERRRDCCACFCRRCAGVPLGGAVPPGGV